jgi:hypothetical protein
MSQSRGLPGLINGVGRGLARASSAAALRRTLSVVSGSGLSVAVRLPGAPQGSPDPISSRSPNPSSNP